MGRTPKPKICDKRSCKQHLYFLKPIQKNLYFTKPERVKFCPKYNNQQNKFESCLPIINKDQKSYTPLFILQDQKNFYMQNDSKFKGNHQKRVVQCQSKSQLMVPRHVRKRQFCAVCKKTYEEYLDHIETQQHKIQLRKNKYTEYILQIADIFSKDKNQKQNENIPQDMSMDVDKLLSSQFVTKSSWI